MKPHHHESPQTGQPSSAPSGDTQHGPRNLEDEIVKLPWGDVVRAGDLTAVAVMNLIEANGKRFRTLEDGTKFVVEPKPDAIETWLLRKHAAQIKRHLRAAETGDYSFVSDAEAKEMLQLVQRCQRKLSARVLGTRGVVLTEQLFGNAFNALGFHLRSLALALERKDADEASRIAADFNWLCDEVEAWAKNPARRPPKALSD